MFLIQQLRRASEPLFKDLGRPQTTYRTNERWVELEYDRVGDVFTIAVGNDRGIIEDWVFNDRDEADVKFDELKAESDMEEEEVELDESEKLKQLLKPVKVVFT